MTVLRNNFDTGPHGTTITTANSGNVPGNNAFEFTAGSAGSTIRQYSTTHARPTAEYTARFATGATPDRSNVGWNTSIGTQTQVWFREYFLLTAYPSIDMTIFGADNGAVYTAFMGISDTGELYVMNGAQSAISYMVTPVPLNEWFRVEGTFQFSTTTGNWDLRVYADADSDTPTEVKAGTGWNLGGSSSNEFAFGYALNNYTNAPSLYLSGLELNNEGWPGPAPFRVGRGSPSGALTNPITVHSGLS